MEKKIFKKLLTRFDLNIKKLTILDDTKEKLLKIYLI